jgi:acyl carrier protein
LNLIAAIESEFGVSIPMDDVIQIRDLASMRAALVQRGADLN